VLWRSQSLLMFGWFDLFGLHPIVMTAREACSNIRPQIPSWVLYSWPDAAWASTGLLVYAAIWSGSRSSARHFWILLPPVLTIAGELGQLLRIVPGTFDLADVLVCFVAGAASFIVARRYLNYAN
jgi:hypothetical protein